MPNATAAPLVLVTVTVCGALVPPLGVVKVRLVLLNAIGEVPVAAFDASFTTCGTALGASSVMMMAPLLVADVGVTCTLTVQLPAFASGVVKQVPVLIW